MDQFHTENERIVALTEKEREAVLGIDPSFRSIESSIYFDNYDLPCPILVTVVSKEDKKIKVVLRKGRHGDVGIEVKIFEALREFGFPVPIIFATPFQNEEGDSVAIYSLLPGENLQKFGMRSSANLEQAKELIIQAVTKLSGATAFIEKHQVGKEIHRFTLIDELEAVKGGNSAWLEEEVFRSVMVHLQSILEEIKTPLVFSNGDYQPGNFLARNGEISGFLDFESPVFQDPLMGFVKYPIYDMLPFARTNLIEIFLDRTGFSKIDFSIRLAIGCLKTLQREISVSGGDEEMQTYRKRVLNLLVESVSH